MVLGPSGILAVHPARQDQSTNRHMRALMWPNGSNAKMYSGEKADRIRGGNNEYIWIDELGAIQTAMCGTKPC
jgi:phage terminase large subunit-like protein